MIKIDANYKIGMLMKNVEDMHNKGETRHTNDVKRYDNL
jgi:hypothetical protein